MHNNVNRAERPTPQHLEKANRFFEEIIGSHDPMEVAEMYQLIKARSSDFLRDRILQKEEELKYLHNALETIITH